MSRVIIHTSLKEERKKVCFGLRPRQRYVICSGNLKVLLDQHPYPPLTNGHVEALRTLSSTVVNISSHHQILICWVLTILPAGSLQPAGSVQLGFGYQRLATSQACLRIMKEMDVINGAAYLLGIFFPSIASLLTRTSIKSAWLG